MLIQRKILDRILGTQDTTQTSAQGRSGHRSVATVSPEEVTFLSRIVKATSPKDLKLGQRFVEPDPDPMVMLRQEPIVRVAYLESLLYDMVKPGSGVTLDDFQKAMKAEGLTQVGEGKFSHWDKVLIISYLQSKIIPLQKMPGNTGELWIVERSLSTLKDRFTRAICNEHDLAETERELIENQSLGDNTFEGDASDGNASEDEEAYYSASESPPTFAGEDGDEESLVSLTSGQQDLFRLMIESPRRLKNCPSIGAVDCVFAIRNGWISKDELEAQPVSTMRRLAKRLEQHSLGNTSAETDSPSASSPDVTDAPCVAAASTQQPEASTAASSKPRPIPAPRTVAIQQRLRDVYLENISTQDLDYFRNSLPDADWGSDRLHRELAWFNCCNRYGAGIGREQFARLHNEGLFSEDMLARVGQRGGHFEQEMRMAVIQLRTIAQTPPKPLPRRQGSARRQEPEVPDARAELTRANIPEEDSNILIAGIKKITRTIVNKLRALYQAMTRTGDIFTAEECALLINSDVVNANELNDLSRQKETLEQLRRSLAAIRESQRMAAEQQAHSSPDDTAVETDSIESQGVSSGEISTEETDFEDSDTESYSDWVNSCYNYFSAREDNNGQPLVATREECQLLFTDLENRYPTPDLLLDKLMYFRNMQFYQDAAKVTFTSRMFSALVLNRQLETDPTVIQIDPELLAQMQGASPKGVDVIVISRNEALKTIASALLNTHNFEPDNTGDQRLRAKGLEPAGAGLYNYNNNCFMNSTLQSMAHSFEACGMLDSMRERPSPHALYNMLDSIYNRRLSGQPREREIWRLAERLYQNPESVHDQDMPQETARVYAAYQNLHESFLDLCDGLNGRTGEATTLVQQQKAFFKAYREYGEVRNKPHVGFLLHTNVGEEVIFGRIPQQDPEEFCTTLTEALGIDQDPRYAIGNSDHLTLNRGTQLLDKKTNPSQYSLSRIPVPLTGNTLQSSIDGYGQKETLDAENQIRWDPDRLRELGVAQDENTTVTKKIVMTAHQPPQQLTLQMKLFSNYDEHGRLLQEPRYMRQEGQELLKRLDRRIDVPMMLQSDGTELESLSDGREVSVPYKVTSIVCHRGGTLNSGHYMTLKFTDDDVIFCDDDIVAYSADYARFQGRDPYETWEELCEREQLTPYLINTVRVDEPLHSPDESFADFSGESSGGFSDGFSDVSFDEYP